jgi:polysaccharide pyruvyl transferase WcaK-like protein
MDTQLPLNSLSTVALHGMHSSQNFGDMLLTEILIKWLQPGTPGKLRLLRPSVQVAETLGVRKAQWTEFRQCRAVILGGGGFFQRMDGSKGATKAILKYAVPIIGAKALGKKTAMLGIGAKPMPSPFLDAILGLAFRCSDLLVVRDPVGHAYALSLLPARLHSRVHLATDLVFSIDRCWLNADDKAWAAAQIQAVPGKRTLAIHLSEPGSAGTAYMDVANILAEEISTQPDVRVLLIEDHPGGNNAQSHAQADMKNRLKDVSTTIIPYPGVQRLAAILSASDAVFTTKLHVGLCSVAMGTPAFSVAKHLKNLVTFDDIGFAENCCFLNDASPDELRRIIGNFARARDRVELPAEIRERAGLARDRLIGFLERDVQLGSRNVL